MEKISFPVYSARSVTKGINPGEYDIRVLLQDGDDGDVVVVFVLAMSTGFTPLRASHVSLLLEKIMPKTSKIHFPTVPPEPQKSIAPDGEIAPAEATLAIRERVAQLAKSNNVAPEPDKKVITTNTGQQIPQLEEITSQDQVWTSTDEFDDEMKQLGLD